jgi:hypothetical protein
MADASTQRRLGEVLRINPDYRADRARGTGGSYFPERDARCLDQWFAGLRASPEQ